MRFVVIFIINLILFFVFPQFSQAGELVDRFAAYPNWNNKEIVNS
ncbi:MAG: hypothetical protein WBM62_22560 [Crocosphaera sp.]